MNNNNSGNGNTAVGGTLYHNVSGNYNSAFTIHYFIIKEIIILLLDTKLYITI